MKEAQHLKFTVHGPDGEIDGYVQIDATFEQLADALRSAYAHGSFTTVQLHPVHRLSVTLRQGDD